MNKDKILKEFNQAKEHLDNIKKILLKCEDESEYERWKPEYGELYYYVSDTGKVMEARNCGWAPAISLEDFYNCFRSEKQAEQEAEKILIRRQLEDIARRLNKGSKVIWSTEGAKYYLYINCDGKIDTDYNAYLAVQGTIYCLDKNFKAVAIQEIGEERLKKYLKGF